MNIVHAIFSQGLAGSECYCADLANWQAEQGHDVTVIIRPQREVVNITSQLDARITVIQLGKIFQKQRAQLIINKLKPHIIHTHLGKACKLIGNINCPCPALVTLHMGYNKPKIYSKMAGLITLTEHDKKSITGYSGAVACIWNWYMPPHTNAHEKNVRAELNIPSDVYVCGTVARIHPQKGIEGLIDAFMHVHKNVDDAHKPHLIIVGGGEKEVVQKLRKQVQSYPTIHVVGHVSNTAPYYNAMNCFILNSRAEAFGLVLLEAMHYGLPIITTQTTGPSEFMVDQPVTFIPIDDTRALETAMHEHVNSPQHKPYYTMENFNRDTQCCKIMEFYAELMR